MFYKPMQFMALMLILVLGISDGQSAEIDTPFGYKVSIDGNHTPQGENGFVLNRGAVLRIASGDKVQQLELHAHGEPVQVVLDEYGVQQATGLFAFTRISADGTETNIPGKLTATQMKLNPQSEMALTYWRGSGTSVPTGNWVNESEGIFRMMGKTSVERIHPKSETLPEVLISMSGEVEGTVISSDLATTGWYEGTSASFWKEAYADLESQKKAVRESKVTPDRVGYQAYQSFLRESQQGLNKLGEGYDMLRQKRYTDEVLKRMVQGRADIPRLDLCSFHIVAGESAFTLDVFENWQGDGRILSNVAYLTNGNLEATHPEFTFFLLDKSRKIGEDTRLVISEGDAYLEVSPIGADTWTMRSPNQFDYLAEIAFHPSAESMKLDFGLDVTGFLLRKGMRVVGQVNIGSLEVTPHSLKVTYQPSAASQRVASDFSGYVALHRIILFPDRDRLLDDYRPEEISEQTWDFLGKGIDHLADGLHRANVDQIDSLVIELKQIGGNQWAFTSDFIGKNGRSGHAEYLGELPSNPVTFLWDKLEASKDATEWLGIDLGMRGME